jgi:hypothetical protein
MQLAQHMCQSGCITPLSHSLLLYNYFKPAKRDQFTFHTNNRKFIHTTSALIFFSTRSRPFSAAPIPNAPRGKSQSKGELFCVRPAHSHFSLSRVRYQKTARHQYLSQENSRAILLYCSACSAESETTRIWLNIWITPTML